MEQGRGLYLAPYKYGRGLYIYLGPYKHTDRAQLQKKKLRQWDDKNAVWRYYQCAFERANVCTYYTLEVFSFVIRYQQAARAESDIVNLDATGPVTHWVAYAKRNNRVVYFDSFGNRWLPKEQYFENGVTMIEYNRTSY